MINLAEEWRKLDGRRRKPDSREHWDERAKTFSFKDAPDAYLRSFISKAGITGKESVLDMGCGTGSLAVALASLGCSVIAADFSTGMLDRLRSNAAERGMLWNGEASRHDSGALPGSGASLVSSDSLAGDGACEGGTRGGTCNAGARNAATPLPEVGAGKILPLHMSWEDDWTSFGLGKNAVDVAVSSRSLITHDLEDSLIKLSTVARERVCVTVGTAFLLVSTCASRARWAWSSNGITMPCMCSASLPIWDMSPPFPISTHIEANPMFRLMRHTLP